MGTKMKLLLRIKETFDFSLTRNKEIELENLTFTRRIEYKLVNSFSKAYQPVASYLKPEKFRL